MDEHLTNASIPRHGRPPGLVEREDYPRWEARAVSGPGGRGRAWASADGSGDADTMDWDRYGTLFATVEGEGNRFGHFGFPHHDVVDGRVITPIVGLVTAAQRASQTNNRDAQQHLTQHYEQWDRTPPWARGASDWNFEQELHYVRTGEDMDSKQSNGAALASALNEAIDGMVTEDRSRADIIRSMASAAGIGEDTVRAILAGDINCPPRERISGFAQTLSGVSVSQLMRAMDRDGCGEQAESHNAGVDMDNKDKKTPKSSDEHCGKCGNELETLKETNAGLQQEIDQLKEKAAAVTTEKSDLEAQVSNLQTEVDKLNQLEEQREAARLNELKQALTDGSDFTADEIKDWDRSQTETALQTLNRHRPAGTPQMGHVSVEGRGDAKSNRSKAGPGIYDRKSGTWDDGTGDA